MTKPSIMNDKSAMELACSQQSIKEALEYLGLRAAGGNYKKFYEYCEKHNLTPPRINDILRTKAARDTREVPNQQVFKENSKYLNRLRIKRRLIDMGMEYKCVICGLGPEWNGSILTLQLDHINSIHNDNRIENLRFLCPNCHTQTDGYAGRGKSY